MCTDGVSSPVIRTIHFLTLAFILFLGSIDIIWAVMIVWRIRRFSELFSADLISQLIFFLLFLLGRPLPKSLRLHNFKSDRGEICSHCSSRKYASIDQSWIFCDVTLSGWRPWHHFAQKSAAALWVCRKHLIGTYAAVCASSWSIVYSYLFMQNLIYCCFFSWCTF